MTSYLSNISNAGCLDFEFQFKHQNIKVPLKYVEKGLLINIDEPFQNFIQCIEDRIIMADIGEKTKKRYLRDLRQQCNQFEILFDSLQSYL
tara:strand:- start:293 stop:565 length:273 start_codon:yes stop_codon:yes gene_type:complete